MPTKNNEVLRIRAIQPNQPVLFYAPTYIKTHTTIEMDKFGQEYKKDHVKIDGYYINPNRYAPMRFKLAREQRKKLWASLNMSEKP